MDHKVQRARVFIKNLPFSVTQEKLQEYYGKYGDVKEVNLLKKPNGQLKGCGFVQFETAHGALEAVAGTNDKSFLGRQISCQLAVFKERKNQIKDEPTEEDSTGVKDEPEKKLEEEPKKKAANSKKKRNKSESISDECTKRIRKNEIDVAEKIDADEDENAEDDSEDVKAVATPTKREFSNDINEGKTVFIKNVPFSATNDDIRECFSQYGTLEYGLVVKDKYTDHSKGTAFVKYHNKEDAEKCLKAGTELQLDDNILDCHVALSKESLEKAVVGRLAGAESELPHRKDKQRSKYPRNLHLVNEGAVLAGSVAAATVSTADMQLRLSIGQQRQRRLKADPEMVVSDHRLIIHNLPAEWSDTKLMKLCKRYNELGRKVLKETRVMRNRDAENTSKGYGYIGCTTHEAAIALLRSINNNPAAFGPPPTPHHRPIVYFSLDDRRALHKLDKRRPKQSQSQPQPKPSTTTAQTETTQGSTKPGKTRLKHNPRRQLQLHREQIKERKHKQRLSRPMKEQWNKRKTAVKEVAVAGKGKKKGDDGFARIVAGYRKGLSASSITATKTKWYDSGAK